MVAAVILLVLVAVEAVVGTPTSPSGPCGRSRLCLAHVWRRKKAEGQTWPGIALLRDPCTWFDTAPSLYHISTYLFLHTFFIFLHIYLLPACLPPFFPYLHIDVLPSLPLSHLFSIYFSTVGAQYIMILSFTLVIGVGHDVGKLSIVYKPQFIEGLITIRLAP